MNMPTQLTAMHQQLIEQIRAEQQAQMAENINEMQVMMAKSQAGCDCDLESLQFSGADVPALQRLENNTNEQAEKDYAEQEQFMIETSDHLPQQLDMQVDSNFLPADAKIITPSWSETFSDTLEDNPLTASSDLNTQPVIGGGNCKNIWNYAKGAGWGCSGGTASNTQVVSWIFWFKPEVSRFYSIKPRFQFNGYYIAKADDKWHNCKSCQVKVSAQTNVYQYNWKGLSSVNMININSQNINRNRRLDDTRYTNYSALLGKDDWAAVVCYAKLYVKAQGGGSYAKNDFSTGANKICVPHVIIS